MRKNTRIFMLVTALALASFTTGCFGKFELTRKLYGWNDSFGNKFVKEIVMWGLWIIPAYELLFAGDFFILNTIEFWTGSNPVASLHPETLPDGSIRVEHNGVALRLIPNGPNQFRILRDEVQVGTATVTGDRGLIFSLAGSDQVVRVSPDDVKRTEAIASHMQIAPAQ